VKWVDVKLVIVAEENYHALAATPLIRSTPEVNFSPENAGVNVLFMDFPAMGTFKTDFGCVVHSEGSFPGKGV